jgi:hypothetical protein
MNLNRLNFHLDKRMACSQAIPIPTFNSCTKYLFIT